MKTCFYLGFIVLTIVSCTSYSKFLNSDVGCDFDQTISEDEFTIDTAFFDSIITKRVEYKHFISYPYYEDDEITKEIKYLSGEPLYYYHTITDKKENIIKYMQYDSIGKLYYLEFKYIVYQDDHKLRRLSVGVEHEYNPSTHEIKNTIDHRDADHYKICYKEALKIVGRLKPKKHYVSSMRRYDEESTDGKTTGYYWEIGVKEPKNSKTYPKTFAYVIDATTGEFVKKMRVVFGP